MEKFRGVKEWMSKAETDVFFALLRSALGSTEPVPAPLQWDCVMYAFEQHALLGVVADAIMSLPESDRPNMGMQMKMLKHVGRLAQAHHRFDQTVCMIFEALTSKGLHPVLLKGQGLATLYPKQHTRSCGDIDLYLHPEEFEQGARIIFDLCGDDRDVIVGDRRIVHHVEANYGDIHIEIHFLPGTSIYESNRDEYERWMTEQFRKTDSVIINAREIAVPNHHANVIYVFCHLLRHFMGSGIGVRQFVDLILLIRSQPIDVKALERDLRRFHLVEPWQTIGGVLVYQLGMKKEDFPLWDEERAEYLQGKNLKFIVSGGNFGRLQRNNDLYKEHDKHSLRGFLDAITYRWEEWMFYNLQFRYHLIPYENKWRAWDSFMFLAKIAINRICKLGKN